MSVLKQVIVQNYNFNIDKTLRMPYTLLSPADSSLQILSPPLLFGGW